MTDQENILLQAEGLNPSAKKFIPQSERRFEFEHERLNPLAEEFKPTAPLPERNPEKDKYIRMTNSIFECIPENLTLPKDGHSLNEHFAASVKRYYDHIKEVIPSPLYDYMIETGIVRKTME